VTEPEILKESRMRSPWPSILAFLGIVAASALITWAACQPTTPN